MKKFLCICLSSAIQRTISLKSFRTAEVNRSEKYRQDAAGKAVNSARVLNQLENGCVRVLCPVGEENASQFLKLASQDNLVVSDVLIPGFTRECWTLMDRSNNSTTELVVNEPGVLDNYDFEEQQFIHSLLEEIKNCDAVLLSGSCPSYFSKNLISVIAKIVCENKKVLLADICGNVLTETLEICTPEIIKINESEFKSSFNYPDWLSEKDLSRAIIEKSRELNNIVVVTRGSSSTFAADKGEFVEFACEKVVPVNTTACGDSFNAGFLYEYMNSGDFESALAKGTWCAARNAESEIPGSIHR